MNTPSPAASVQELMQRDPLLLSETDITAVIEHFRKSRHTFKTTGSAPRKAAAKPESAAAKKKANIAASLDLGDLKL